MLNIKMTEDFQKMKSYYRTSDMINLIKYFPEICSILNLVIINDELDYLENKQELENLDHIRVDSLKGRNIIRGIEVSGPKDVISIIRKVKEKDSEGVVVLFNFITPPSERYEKYAGISIRIDVGESIYIDAVGKGFDGREVSKSICIHERYYIPWFELRKCCIENFKEYQTYQINNDDYYKTRLERVKFLKSIGLDYEIFSKYIPETYEPIPDFIWLSVIKGILKPLEKKEEILLNDGFSHFAISGHTEGKDFCPWQMFDKNRYEQVKSRSRIIIN